VHAYYIVHLTQHNESQHRRFPFSICITHLLMIPIYRWTIVHYKNYIGDDYGCFANYHQSSCTVCTSTSRESRVFTMNPLSHGWYLENEPLQD
jgi:hypothetical protein